MSVSFKLIVIVAQGVFHHDNKLENPMAPHGMARVDITEISGSILIPVLL